MSHLSFDPSMRIYCPIHSEQRSSDGGRAGQVMAHYDRKAQTYVCWHCASAREDSQMANAPLGRDGQVPA